MGDIRPQNIPPPRTELGTRLRKMLRAPMPAGGDYTETELRLLREARAEAQADLDRHHEAFLLHLVDVVWGDAMEDGQVPATDHARKLIARARETFDG